jgi:hypothetical protein
MKKILLIIVVLIGINKCYSQEMPPGEEEVDIEQAFPKIPTKDGQIFYDFIIDAKGMNKDELFVKLRHLLVEFFVDSKDVLEVNDKENHLMTGKGTIKYGVQKGMNFHYGRMYFVINIATKDDKFRVQLYNFIAKGEKLAMDVTLDFKNKEETFPIDELYKQYVNGNNRQKRYAAKYLVKVIVIAKHMKRNFKEIGSGNKDDISDF